MISWVRSWNDIRQRLGDERCEKILPGYQEQLMLLLAHNIDGTFMHGLGFGGARH